MRVARRTAFFFCFCPHIPGVPGVCGSRRAGRSPRVAGNKRRDDHGRTDRPAAEARCSCRGSPSTSTPVVLVRLHPSAADAPTTLRLGTYGIHARYAPAAEPLMQLGRAAPLVRAGPHRPSGTAETVRRMISIGASQEIGSPNGGRDPRRPATMSEIGTVSAALGWKSCAEITGVRRVGLRPPPPGRRRPGPDPRRAGITWSPECSATELPQYFLEVGGAPTRW